MKPITGIHYHKEHQAYACNVRSRNRRVFLGYFPTRYLAEQAKQEYMNRFNTGPIDYNLLAKDDKAWELHAHNIVKKLSREVRYA